MRDLIAITVRIEELIVNAIETFDELLEDSEIGAVEPTSWFGVEVMNVPLIFLCLLIGLLLIMVEPWRNVRSWNLVLML